MSQRETAVNTPPIACRLSGAERDARGEQVNELFREVEQVSELADGYGFRFAGSEAMAARLLVFTLAERACCPFFTFDLVFEPDLGPIWLRLHGATGVKEFVASAWGEVLAAHA